MSEKISKNYTLARKGRRREEGRCRFETGPEDRLYTKSEIEFMMAMDKYKREKNCPFPTWCEVLEVLISLGYKKHDI